MERVLLVTQLVSRALIYANSFVSHDHHKSQKQHSEYVCAFIAIRFCIRISSRAVIFAQFIASDVNWNWQGENFWITQIAYAKLFSRWLMLAELDLVWAFSRLSQLRSDTYKRSLPFFYFWETQNLLLYARMRRRKSAAVQRCQTARRSIGRWDYRKPNMIFVQNHLALFDGDVPQKRFWWISAHLY